MCSIKPIPQANAWAGQGKRGFTMFGERASLFPPAPTPERGLGAWSVERVRPALTPLPHTALTGQPGTDVFSLGLHYS